MNLSKRTMKMDKEDEEPVTIPEEKSVKERFKGNEVIHDVDVMYLFPPLVKRNDGKANKDKEPALTLE